MSWAEDWFEVLRHYLSIANALISNVLTGHRSSIAVGRDRLISNLLCICTCTITKVSDTLVANQLRGGGFAVAVVCYVLIPDPLGIC